MIKKKEKVFISFNTLRDNWKEYSKKITSGEIELYLTRPDGPPFKISLADIS